MRDTERTRASIVDAAMALFVTDGIDGTTTRAIAARAGVSEGLLYRYFPGKERMAWDIFRENYLAYSAEVAAILDAGRPLPETVEALLRYFARSFDAEPMRFRYLLMTQHNFIARITDEMGSPARLIDGYLRGAIRRGECRVPNATLATAVLAGPLLQTATAIVSGALAGPLAKWIDALVAATQAALAGRAPGRGGGV